MSDNIGDAIKRRLNNDQSGMSDAEKMAQAEARRRAAEEAKRLIQGNNPMGEESK